MRKMKDSGVAWIGEIPDDWRLIRFKDKYRSVKEIAKGQSVNYERLALTLGGVVKRPKDDSEGLQPKEFDGYQILRENDFIFKMIDLQNVSTSRVGLNGHHSLSGWRNGSCPPTAKTFCTVGQQSGPGLSVPAVQT